MRTKLTGVVTVHGGERASIATVELHNAAGDVIDQVTVDDEGRFTYYLAPGDWTLQAWDDQGHRGGAQVTLDPDETRELNLHLQEPETSR